MTIPYMEQQVIVKASSINGRGVFAARNFKKGEVVLHWDVSFVLAKEEVDALDHEQRKYISPYKGKFIMQQPPACYVNHSCEPNTCVVDECKDVALRDIKQGEEITSDYTLFFLPGETMRCTCNAKTCRKLLRRRKQ